MVLEKNLDAFHPLAFRLRARVSVRVRVCMDALAFLSFSRFMKIERMEASSINAYVWTPSLSLFRSETILCY